MKHNDIPMLGFADLVSEFVDDQQVSLVERWLHADVVDPHTGGDGIQNQEERHSQQNCLEHVAPKALRGFALFEIFFGIAFRFNFRCKLIQTIFLSIHAK